MKSSLVVPVFNEAEAIPFFLHEVASVFACLPSCEVEIIFINDGSSDDTLKVLLESQRNNQQIVIVDLTRNFGKEAALTAGIYEAMGDLIVPIDVDLPTSPHFQYHWALESGG
jgi:glycosyltransferase involved in cell wall biosynthesis